VTRPNLGRGIHAGGVSGLSAGLHSIRPATRRNRFRRSVREIDQNAGCLKMFDVALVGCRKL
jgi:hypothetical protein